MVIPTRNGTFLNKSLQKKSRPAVHFYTCALVMHWINRPFMRAKLDQRVSWWSGGKKYYQLKRNILDKQIVW